MPPVADAIVVAAGTSAGWTAPTSSFATLGGRPLLEHSLAALAGAPEVRRIVLVVAPGREADAAALSSGRVVTVIPGGTHRGASVEAGFRALEATLGGTTRPPDAAIRRARSTRSSWSMTAPGRWSHRRSSPRSRSPRRRTARPSRRPVRDTLKRVVDGRIGSTVDRSDLVAAQTPQGARASLLRRALATFPADGPTRFTDEAALLEACTIPVHPIPGDPVNLKVTVPADLLRAEALLGGRGVAPRRPRLGFDIRSGRANRSGWAA